MACKDESVCNAYRGNLYCGTGPRRGFQSSSGVPESCAEVLVGIILFFMLGCEFFINYKLVFRGKEAVA